MIPLNFLGGRQMVPGVLSSSLMWLVTHGEWTVLSNAVFQREQGCVVSSRAR